MSVKKLKKNLGEGHHILTSNNLTLTFQLKMTGDLSTILLEGFWISSKGNKW